MTEYWVILPRYRQIGAAGRPVLDRHRRKQWRRPLSFRPGTQSAFVKALVGAIRAYRPGLIPDTARPGPLPAWSGSDEFVSRDDNGPAQARPSSPVTQIGKSFDKACERHTARLARSYAPDRIRFLRAAVWSYARDLMVFPLLGDGDLDENAEEIWQAVFGLGKRVGAARTNRSQPPTPSSLMPGRPASTSFTASSSRPLANGRGTRPGGAADGRSSAHRRKARRIPARNAAGRGVQTDRSSRCTQAREAALWGAVKV